MSSAPEAILFLSRAALRAAIMRFPQVRADRVRSLEEAVGSCIRDTMRHRWPDLRVAVEWVPAGQITEVENHTGDPEVGRELLAAALDAECRLRGNGLAVAALEAGADH